MLGERRARVALICLARHPIMNFRFPPNFTNFTKLSAGFSLWLVGFVVLAHVGIAASEAETIKEIVVAENSKSTDDTVRFISGLDEGDEWSDSVQAKAQVDMVSSGLFKDVSVYSEPHPEGGGVRVTIIAKDKHSWVIAPAVYNQPTNRGIGVGFGENNLFGENKKLLLYGQVATGDSFFVGAYIDPSIGSTPLHWALDVYLQNARVFEYKPPTKWREQTKQVRESRLRYLNSGIKLGVTLFRSLTLDGRIRGAKVFYADVPKLAIGATKADVGVLENEAVPKPGDEGWDVSAEVILKFDRTANWYGIMSGNRYQFTYEKALPGLGSDFDYWYSTTSYRRARKYYDFHNLILKASVGYGKNIPFQHERSSGGTSLRGYKNAQFRGDFKVSSNLEYSAQIFEISGFALRGLIFGDATYTAFLNRDEDDPEPIRHFLPETGDLGLAPLKTSVGIGTRVFLRQVVIPLLGIDVGYGLEGGEVEIYLAIGITDF